MIWPNVIIQSPSWLSLTTIVCYFPSVLHWACGQLGKSSVLIQPMKVTGSGNQLSDKITIMLTQSLFYLTTISCNGLAIWESTCRQYYSYVTDTQCKRVGTQCWVYGAIMVTEALLCIKNGKELFERTQAINIIIWLLLQLLLSVLCVYGCVLWHKYFQVC